MRSLPKALNGCALILAAMLMFGACTSAENKAFCDKAEKYEKELKDIDESDPEFLGKIGAAFADMTSVAPASIKADMKAASDAMVKVSEVMESEDMDAMMELSKDTAFQADLEERGEKVDKFINEECGISFG